MKSLAHPEWPYAGTAHEWRGFAAKFAAAQQPLGEEFSRVLMDNAWDLYARDTAENAVYQKQNFGPKLD